MLPQTESLRCFVAAAKLLSFRAAARSVALTPAAFGQRIKLLEEEVGVPLFTRTTRSVRLTEAGLAMLPNAENALLFAAQCARVGGARGPRAAMDIVLGTRHELGMSWVLPQVNELSREHDLSLQLYFGSGSDLVLRVRTMDIDCAVTSTRFTDPKLDSLKLHREDYVFVASTDLLREHPLSRAEHAESHTLIDTDASLPLFHYFRDAPAARDLSLRFGKIARFGTIDAIKNRVLGGAGVAVLPAYFCQKELERGTLKRLFPRITPEHDWFRLVFRADDARRTVYEAISRSMLRRPLR
jgi:LysR family glycine cleavage system transcriptional activator